jgi:hypothetical protein
LALLLLSWHYAPFHEEWGFSLDKLNGDGFKRENSVSCKQLSGAWRYVRMRIFISVYTKTYWQPLHWPGLPLCSNWNANGPSNNTEYVCIHQGALTIQRY